MKTARRRVDAAGAAPRTDRAVVDDGLGALEQRLGVVDAYRFVRLVGARPPTKVSLRSKGETLAAVIAEIEALHKSSRRARTRP
jgi:hypothetical protein